MNLRSVVGLWQVSVALVLMISSAWADFPEILAMPAPERVSPEEFQAPGQFQPSADLGIVPIPSPHFTPVGPDRQVDTVVLHYTSGINVDANNPFDVDMNWNIFHYYEVSSHYMIGRDGTIYQLVRESDRAWHAGRSIMPEPDNRQGVNDFSIGIETIGVHGGEFTNEQYESIVALVRDIRQRHPVPMENIVGHEDIGGERAVEMGLRTSPKTDPGPSFDWERVRAGVAAIDMAPEVTPLTQPASGTVYRDENANSVRDDGEAGWPGIGVSNGVSIVVTDEEGRYTVEPTSPEGMEMLFVIQPADSQITPHFYQRIDAIEDFDAVDFGLVPAEVAEGPLTFAQVTDIHVGRREDYAEFFDAMHEIDNHPAPMDFIMATGDLVNRGGTDEQLETYAAVVDHANRPWMSCFGNHDSDERSAGTSQYRYFVGPDYYSFSRGACHFIVRNSIFPTDTMDEWIRESVRVFGEDKTIIVFQHYPPTREEQFQDLQDIGATAVITGHWHSNRIVEYENVLSVNSPTFMMGAIDLSPSGFRLVSVDDETITTRFMYGRTGRVLSLLEFGEELELRMPVWGVHAAAWDSENDLSGVEMGIRLHDGADQAHTMAQLDQHSPLGWSWTQDYNALFENPGLYDVTLTATDGRGNEWSREYQVNVQPAIIDDLEPLLTPWPMFMGSPAHTGKTDITYQTPMRLDWIASSGATLDFGSPVTDGVRVYLGLRDRDNLDHNAVVAHDPYTGERLWRTPTQTSVCNSVATDGERVYAVDQGGRVYALDAETGGEVWTHDLNGDSRFRWNYSAPMLAEGSLICGSTGGIARLDPETGEAMWDVRPGSDWISCWATPAVSDGKIVMAGIWQGMGGRGNSIVALDLASGEIQWGSHTSGLHGSPTIHDGRVYFADIDGNYKVLDLGTGEEIHSVEIGGGWTSCSPAIDPESGICVTGGGDGLIHAFDIEMGEEIWTLQTDESAFRMSAYSRSHQSLLSSPTIAGDTVFIGSGDGLLRAIDVRTGEVEWSNDFGVPTLSAPCPSGGRLFVTTLDGSLICLRSGTGMTDADHDHSHD